MEKAKSEGEREAEKWGRGCGGITEQPRPSLARLMSWGQATSAFNGRRGGPDGPGRDPPRRNYRHYGALA